MSEPTFDPCPHDWKAIAIAARRLRRNDGEPMLTPAQCLSRAMSMREELGIRSNALRASKGTWDRIFMAGCEKGRSKPTLPTALECRVVFELLDVSDDDGVRDLDRVRLAMDGHLVRPAADPVEPTLTTVSKAASLFAEWQALLVDPDATPEAIGLAYRRMTALTDGLNAART
jgi:hypothetical protein